VRLRDCILEGIPREYQDAIRDIGEQTRKDREEYRDPGRLINSFFEDFFKPKQTPAAEIAQDEADDGQDMDMEDVGGIRDVVHA
jgi:hypothetical protein